MVPLLAFSVKQPQLLKTVTPLKQWQAFSKTVGVGPLRQCWCMAQHACLPQNVWSGGVTQKKDVDIYFTHKV